MKNKTIDASMHKDGLPYGTFAKLNLFSVFLVIAWKTCPAILVNLSTGLESKVLATIRYIAMNCYTQTHEHTHVPKNTV